MNVILEGSKIPSTCIGVRVPILNEAVAKNRKLCHFIKELIRDCQILKKRLVFATSAVLETADELILAQNEIDRLTSGKLCVTWLILLP